MKLSNKLILLFFSFAFFFMGICSFQQYRSIEANVTNEATKKSDAIYGMMMSVRAIYQKQFLNSGIPLTDAASHGERSEGW